MSLADRQVAESAGGQKAGGRRATGAGHRTDYARRALSVGQQGLLFETHAGKDSSAGDLDQIPIIRRHDTILSVQMDGADRYRDVSGAAAFAATISAASFALASS